MLLRVEDIVRNAPQLQHAAEFFRDIYGCCTHKHRSPRLGERLNIINDRIEFFPCGLEHQILAIITLDRTVGRNDHDIKFIDLPELTCLSFCRTGHTGQLVIHAEIILQGHCSIGLGDLTQLDIFFGFKRLVQTIRISAAFHQTSGLLVNDLDLAIQHYIFFIFFKKRVSFEQLVDGMQTP